MIVATPKTIILAVITAIALTVGTLGYFKYTSMVSTIADQATKIEELTNSFNGCKTTISTLEFGITAQNKGLAELTEMNALLVSEVEDSRAKIRKIRKDRDMALDNLGKVPIPASCEAKFDWMIDRAEEIR